MARRVNTKFVILLMVTLAGIGGAGAGWYWWQYSQQRDPALLEKQALEARGKGEALKKSALEARGKEEALKKSALEARTKAATLDAETAKAEVAKAEAMEKQAEDEAARAEGLETLMKDEKEVELNFEIRAAGWAVNKGWSRRAEMCATVAQLYYETSDKDPGRYFNALTWWRRAIKEDGTNRAAQERLMQELHNYASYSDNSNSWKDLETEATNLLRLDPKNGVAYAYRGEAILHQITVDAMEKDRATAAGEDLNRAMQLAPNDATAYLALARHDMDVARDKERKGPETEQLAKEVRELREGAMTVVQGFLKLEPKNTQAWITLGSMKLEQSGRAAKLKADAATAEQVHADAAKVAALKAEAAQAEAAKGEALAAFEQPVKLTPGDPKAYEGLAGYYFAAGNIAEAEKQIQRMIAAQPSAMGPQYQLATFYHMTRKYEKAAAAYEEVLNRKGEGLGAEALRNGYVYGAAQHAICMVYLDLAQAAGGMATADGKKWIEKASSYVNVLRGQKSNNPALYFFDGYLLSLNDTKLAEAAMMLRKADEIYSPQDPRATQLGDRRVLDMNMWLRTKIQLAMVFQRSGQDGSAIECYNQVLGQIQYRNLSQPYLMRAGLELKLTRYAEAFRDAEVILRAEPTNEAALRIKAGAYVGLGQRQEADDLLKTIDKPETAVVRARLALIGGDPQAALEALELVWQRDPGNEQALAVAAVAAGQLADRTDDEKAKTEYRQQALKYVDKALEKNQDSVQFKMMRGIIMDPKASRTDLYKTVIEGIADPYDRAMTYYQFYMQQRDGKKAMESLLAAEAAKPEAQDPVDRIFMQGLQEQNWALAEKYAQKAQVLNIDGVQGKLYRGRLLLAKGDKSQALATLQAAVAERPDFSMGHMTLAQAYLEAGQAAAAREELLIAIGQMPNNIGALKLLIQTDLMSGDKDRQTEARAKLVEALKYAANDEQLRAFDDLIGDAKAVILRRTKVLLLNPGDMENRKGLAQALVRDGQIDRAVEVFKPVYDAKRSGLAKADGQAIIEFVRIADSLAKLYRAMNRNDDAMSIYQDLMAGDKAELKLGGTLLLGDMYHTMGQLNEAVKLYDDARAIEPKGDTEAERRMADLYFEAEDLNHAEEMYKKLADADGGKDLHVVRRYAETLIREDKFQAADELLKARVFKEHPDDPEGLVLSGYALLRQRQPQKAVECFNKVLEKNGDNTDALHYRAFSQFFMQGNVQQAIADLIHVRNINKDLLNSRLLLARVYRQSRDYNEAVKEYQAVVAIQPDSMAARAEYADFLYSLAENALRIPADSSDAFARMLREIKPVETLGALLADSATRFPKQPIWQIRLGDLLRLNKQPEQAAAQYFQTMQNSGQNPLAGAAYVGMLVEMKHFDQAERAATGLIATNPDYSELYIKRARAFAGQNRQTEALADFDHALQLAAKNVPAFLNVVRQLYVALPADVSAAHLQQRLTADPKDLPTRIGLTQVYLTAERGKEAEETAAPLLTDPAAAPAKAGVLRLMALACYQAREFDKSLGYYEQLLALAPGDLETLNNMAYLLANDLNPPQPKKALERSEQAVKVVQMQPMEIAYVNNGNVFDTYGWCKFLNGDTSGALEELNRSLQTDPLPVTYYHLGMIRVKQGRLGEAKQAFEACIQLGRPKQDPAVPLAEAELKKLQSR